MRGRALTILGAAGVVIGLFGYRATAAHPHGARLWASIVAVTLFAVCAVAVIKVQKRFVFDAGDHVGPWLAEDRGSDHDPQFFAVQTARALDAARTANKTAYDAVVFWSFVLQIAFGLEVIVWALTVLI